MRYPPVLKYYGHCVLFWDCHLIGNKNIFSQPAMLCCPKSIFYKTIYITLKSGILIIFFIGSAIGEYIIIIIMSCCCVLSDLIKPFYFLVSVVHLVSLKCFYDSFSNWFCFLLASSIWLLCKVMCSLYFSMDLLMYFFDIWNSLSIYFVNKIFCSLSGLY